MFIAHNSAFIKLFPRFCCWTPIWLSHHWAWLRRDIGAVEVCLIDWLILPIHCSVLQCNTRTVCNGALRSSVVFCVDGGSLPGEADGLWQVHHGHPYLPYLCKWWVSRILNMQVTRFLTVPPHEQFRIHMYTRNDVVTVIETGHGALSFLVFIYDLVW